VVCEAASRRLDVFCGGKSAAGFLEGGKQAADSFLRRLPLRLIPEALQLLAPLQAAGQAASAAGCGKRFFLASFHV
jgi:hypothetical protein